MIGINSSRKLINYEKLKVKLTDVKGVEEAKEKVKKEIVDFLKNNELGAKIFKGFFSVTYEAQSKTLLTKAVAGETVVHYISILWFHPSPKFLCGWTQTVCKIVLKTINKNQHAIVFIDEIDFINKNHVDGNIIGGNDECVRD